MRSIAHWIWFLCIVATSAFFACGQSSPADEDAGTTDADGDTDADTDTDTDADADGDTDTEEQECVPGGADSMVMDIPVDLSDPVQGLLTVSFATAEPVFVNVSTGLGENQAQTFQLFKDLQRPLFAWIDPDTRHVLDIIITIEGKVLNLTEAEESIDVVLMASAALYRLWRDSECFDHLYEELQAALAGQTDVEVSSDDVLGIVDVRPAFDL